MSRFRNFVFTINNHTESVITRLNDQDALKSRIDYMCVATEVGERGTPHLQGYFETSGPMSFAAVKKFLVLTKEIHLESRRGTQQQAIEYCKKDEPQYATYNHVKTVYEWGLPKSSSRRPVQGTNKILGFKDVLLTEGLQAVSNDPDCSFHLLKHAQAYLSINEAPRDSSLPLKVLWFWGPTGTGKTRRAYHECTQADVIPYVKTSGGRWFDGYDGESHVIFDDMRDNWFEFSFLLKLLDRYPCRVEVKGSSRQWKPTVVYVTAPKPPHEFYKAMQSSDAYDSIKQLLRRVTVIEEFLCEWTPPTIEEDRVSQPDPVTRFTEASMPYPSPGWIRRCMAVQLPTQTQLFQCPSPPLTPQTPCPSLPPAVEDLVSVDSDH